MKILEAIWINLVLWVLMLTLLLVEATPEVHPTDQGWHRVYCDGERIQPYFYDITDFYICDLTVTTKTGYWLITHQLMSDLIFQYQLEEGFA